MASSSSNAQQSPYVLEIYIDKATLPSVQQAAMIAHNQSQNPKLICWQRHPVNNEALLKGINATSFASIASLCQHATKLLAGHPHSYITIYGNTYWSKDLARLIRCLTRISGVEIKKLELIDDGSSEYQKMFNWQRLSFDEQTRDLATGLQNLKSYLSGSDNKLLRLLTGHSNKLPRRISSFMNWHQLFPTTYHMLRMDYLDKPELHQLKQYLANNTQQIRWNYIADNLFDDEQQSLFYQLLGISLAEQNQLKTGRQQQHDFMFIGVDSSNASSELQINVIADSRQESGVIPTITAKKMLFKGHPFADFNQTIVNAHQMGEMPAMIPFETLIMTGNLPQKVGGMASSLYFSLPKNYHIEYIVFTGSKQDLEEHALLQIMLYLKVISPERVYFSEQFKPD
ncbi:hypothetical protein [Shewanella kaireitica]|uniref:hypothetical protein n=1 Tax=Shewanella kaireitica TaxID=212021 RepID=UPI00200F6792|nr:hypothetical protein [Shewanella kaireitica]